MADKPLVAISIDGKEVRVPAGTNIIEAAKQVGVSIPHYCYHDHLSVAGNCRMCLIEMGTEMKDRATGQTVMDENGKPKIGWMPRPQIACATNAGPGQHFRTTTPIVTDARNAVTEFLLVNHPLDCPICDQAGECKLQEYSAEHGKGASRFVEEKNHKPKRSKLGPKVTLDDERCILCSRCIRFCKEVVKDDVLGFVDRGSFSTLTCYPGKELNNNYSLNTVDICPVGALTSTDFRFKMRVWFLKETPSICTESATGVNTLVGSREGKLYRITPRKNNAVNDSWMTDSGRELIKLVDAPNRITAATVNANELIAKQLQKGRVAIVASGHMSLEEQYLLKRLATLTAAAHVVAVPHVAAGDGLLISADRTPNMRGALLTGLIKDYPTSNLSVLKEAIAENKVGTILTVREDLLAAGLTPEELRKVVVIQLDTHTNTTTPYATLVQPLATVFERSGSFINEQWRLQKFAQALPTPEGVPTDIAYLGSLLHKLGEVALPAPTPEAVWKLLAVSHTQLRALSYATIPAVGVVVDGSAWDLVRFPASKTLHSEIKA